MSSGCEIVRYRANMEAVFSVTYYQNELGLEKRLKRSEKEINPKTHCCGISKFDPINCPVDGGHSSLNSHESPRRQRVGAGESFEQIDDL
jgi:hypothetical protein